MQITCSLHGSLISSGFLYPWTLRNGSIGLRKSPSVFVIGWGTGQVKCHLLGLGFFWGVRKMSCGNTALAQPCGCTKSHTPERALVKDSFDGICIALFLTKKLRINSAIGQNTCWNRRMCLQSSGVLGNVPLLNYKPRGMFGDFSNLASTM